MTAVEARLRPGSVAHGNAIVLDRAQHPEGTGARGDHARPVHLEGLGESLELRGGKRDERRREGEEGRGEAEPRARTAQGPPAAPPHRDRGGQPERGEPLEHGLGRRDVEPPDDPRRAETGSGEIRRVHRGNALPVAEEGERDAVRASEEGQREAQEEQRQPPPLPGTPGDFQGIEGQRLSEREAKRRAGPEEGRVRHVAGPEARGAPAPREAQEGAARPKAEQGETDDEVGEVVPVDDREQAREQHLVGERRRRDERDGEIERAGG